MKTSENTLSIPGSEIDGVGHNCVQETVNWKGEHWSAQDGDYGDINPTPITKITWTYGSSGNTKIILTSQKVIYLIKY